MSVIWCWPSWAPPITWYDLGLSASIFVIMWIEFSKEEHVFIITLAVVWRMALGGGMETRRPRKIPWHSPGWCCSDYGSDSGNENKSGFEILLLIEPIGLLMMGMRKRKIKETLGLDLHNWMGGGTICWGVSVCACMCIHTHALFYEKIT